MSTTQRDSFTFFRSFRDAIEKTAPEEQLSLYKMLVNYALDQREPDVSSLRQSGQLCWTVFRPILRSGIVKFQNGCRGGAPKGNANAVKQPKNNQKTSNRKEKNRNRREKE